MSKQTELVECEIWVLVSESGTYEVGADPAEFDADPAVATRLVKVVVKVPLPRPVEVAVTVPDLPDDAAVTVG